MCLQWYHAPVWIIMENTNKDRIHRTKGNFTVPYGYDPRNHFLCIQSCAAVGKSMFSGPLSSSGSNNSTPPTKDIQTSRIQLTGDHCFCDTLFHFWLQMKERKDAWKVGQVQSIETESFISFLSPITFLLSIKPPRPSLSRLSLTHFCSIPPP